MEDKVIEVPKLGPIQEAIIRKQAEAAAKKQNLPAKALTGWTNQGATIEQQQVSDRTKLQDLSVDLAEERKKKAVAAGAWDLAVTGGPLAKNNVDTPIKRPWYKMFFPD